MLRKFKTVALVAIAMLGVHFGAIASSNGTADEAKAMVDRAVKLLESEGKDGALHGVEAISMPEASTGDAIGLAYAGLSPFCGRA